MTSTLRANRGGTMARSGRKRMAAVVAGIVAGSAGAFALLAASATPAFANTSPYEVYCPGTPVGNIVLNDAVTNGTITPASPASGQQFTLTGYQSVISLPSAIVSAASALGNSAITGTATLKVDATGATPASVASSNLAINAPIPSPVPAAGLTLNLPAAASTVGPFTATGGAISLTVDPSISLVIAVSGSNLNLTCSPYPNNTAPSGITSTTPAGPKASPVIATATAGGAAPPSTAPAATTPAPAATTPAPSTLATTGPGPHLWLVAVIGFVVLYLGSVALALVERPRSLLRRLLHMVRPSTPVPLDMSTELSMANLTPASVPTPPAPAVQQARARPAYPKADGSQGLWFDGWEPTDRS